MTVHIIVLHEDDALQIFLVLEGPAAKAHQACIAVGAVPDDGSLHVVINGFDTSMIDQFFRWCGD